MSRALIISQRKLIGLVAGLFLILSGSAYADGNETLGPPSIPIASGTGYVANGVGTVEQFQPNSFTLDVPAGAAVNQVLLYWHGFTTTQGPDDNISINGIPVAGTLISPAGPDLFPFNNRSSWAYRADITGLGLVSPGSNTLTITNMNFQSVSNGAGVLAVIDDGSSSATVGLRDGDDIAFFLWAPPADTTVPQTFNFAAAPTDRAAKMTNFFASIQGTASRFGMLRPTTIVVQTDVGPEQQFINVPGGTGSYDGDEWDTTILDVNIPAGATSLTIQVFSDDRLMTGERPASFVWIASGLEIISPPGIDIEKATNGVDADDPNAGDAPQVQPGDPVTWTYVVTNTGGVPLANVTVFDDPVGPITCPQMTLAVGESIICTAMGIADDLSGSASTVPGTCGSIPNRPLYENMGTVTADDPVTGQMVTDVDPSHYCNPEAPAIDIEKATNGIDADDPNAGDAPRIVPGDTVTWSYVVTNTGTVTLVNIQAVDEALGVPLTCPTTTLAPMESMSCANISQPAMQLALGDPNVVEGTCGSDPGKPLYENIASVTASSEAGTPVEDADPSHYCNPGEPDIDIRKQAEGPDNRVFPSGSDVPFLIVVTNTGTVDLINVVVTDILVPQCDFDIGFLAIGDSVSYTCTAPGVIQTFTNEACVSGEDGNGTPVADCDPSTVEIPPVGGEGCTPGFWKAPQHFPAWFNPPYDPSTPFSDVFENAFPGMTLLQVLQQGGGGLKALGRHTVAALLNAATADVSYDVGTPQGVIDAFNAVFPGSKGDYTGLKDEFKGFNEQGCPINGKSPPSNL